MGSYKLINCPTKLCSKVIESTDDDEKVKTTVVWSSPTITEGIPDNILRKATKENQEKGVVGYDVGCNTLFRKKYKTGIMK